MPRQLTLLFIYGSMYIGIKTKMSEDQNPTQVEIDTLPRRGGVRKFLGRLGLVQSPGREVDEAIQDPFETDNFVKTSPSLMDVGDKASSRIKTFKYIPGEQHVTSEHIGSPEKHPEAEELTEGEGVQSFLKFLGDIDNRVDELEFDREKLANLIDAKGDDKKMWGYGLDMPSPAEDIKSWFHRKVEALKHTSFIGTKEFEEATAGLAQYWKAYLLADKDRQICIPDSGSGKSQSFVLERILSNFSEAELQSLGNRFIKDVSEFTASPDKVKIILVDDWMMSGDQMYERRWDGLRSIPFGDTETADRYRERIEINLLIADEKRLNEGSTYTSYDKALPVKAYFKAPTAMDAADAIEPEKERYLSRISGVYSSADSHFSLTVSNLLTILREFGGTNIPPMPPLTNIVRSYRKNDRPLTKKLLDIE